MTCHFSADGGMVLCRPTITSTQRVVRLCFDCKRRRRMRLIAEEWYGFTLTCGTCGRSFTNDGDGWERRPFTFGHEAKDERARARQRVREAWSA